MRKNKSKKILEIEREIGSEREACASGQTQGPERTPGGKGRELFISYDRGTSEPNKPYPILTVDSFVDPLDLTSDSRGMFFYSGIGCMGIRYVQFYRFTCQPVVSVSVSPAFFFFFFLFFLLIYNIIISRFFPQRKKAKI